MFCQFIAKSKQLKKQLMIKPQDRESPSRHLLHVTNILYVISGLKIVNVWNAAESVTQL